MESSRSFSTGADHTRERFEFAAVGGYGLMVFRSLRRHPALFLAVWLGVVALTALGLAVLPRTYDVQTTLQVARSTPTTAVVSKTAQRDLDAPTRIAAATVHRHENLVALVRQTDLLNRWNLHRAPLLKAKDALWAKLFRPPTNEEREEGFVGLLEKRIWVDATPDTVSIGILFPDPELAFDLVQAALENFLQARRTSEISSIEETIGILEARSAEAHEAVEAALAAMGKARSARATRLGVRPRPVTDSLDRPVDKAGAQLITEVQARRQQLAALEEARRRRVLELQTQLDERRAVYSDSHPEVTRLEQDLEALRREPPELQALRNDLGTLEAELRRRGLLADVPLGAKRVRSLSSAAALEPLDPREEEDADVAYTKAQVRHGLARYNGLLDRIDAARLELDNAQAAFKRRYVLVHPPQRPNGPVKPRVTLVLLASAVAGAVLGLFAPLLVDLVSRRLVEPWQVEQVLGVPLLGKVSER